MSDALQFWAPGLFVFGVGAVVAIIGYAAFVMAARVSIAAPPDLVGDAPAGACDHTDGLEYYAVEDRFTCSSCHARLRSWQVA